MFVLRHLTSDDVSTISSLKRAMVQQVGESILSRKLNFQVGYYHKCTKLWLNNQQDLQDALRQSGKLTLWCVGLEAGCDSDPDTDGSSDEPTSKQRPTKKRRLSTMSEERASRVNEIKTKLRLIHGSKFSNVQYALWAEMILGGTHESTDDPPPVPMFGAQRPRGRSSTGNLADALTDVADKIASALSPVSARACSPSGQYSPSKSVELRGKYMQQLKEMVNLRDIGALTSDEYEEQRSVVVNLMRQLSSN